MPRDIPVGNGDVLVTFDKDYRVRDLYYPRVGRFNHTDGHVQRFGVWVDGTLSWVEEDGWTRELRYKPDSLVTEVRLVHKKMGIELTCQDAVDFHEAIYFKRVVVRDLLGKERDVRVFFHIDLSIGGSPVGDTANYDPSTSSVVLYKDDFYFLYNACDRAKCGIDHWAIGSKRVGGAEGTWRDAEDGRLGRNAISQGSVDATIGSNLVVPPNGESYVCMWCAMGRSYEDVKRLNRLIWERTPEALLARTEAYWKLWSRKEEFDTSPLPEHLRDAFYRSQLILRTQVDNGGAIIAANDSDITHFAGDHYSYCWPRDGALVDWALIKSGQSELSRSFLRFAAKCIGKDGYFLHKYTPEGRLASSWHPWMLEGQEILPIQQDETALVVWVLERHFDAFKDVEFVKPLYEPLVVRPAEWMLSYRDHHGLPRQSWDLWEERRGVHLFTVASTIAALKAAGKMAARFGDPERAAKYAEGAEHMRQAMVKQMWNPDQKRFARMVVPLEGGDYRLDMTRDSANYALSFLGVFDADDPMMVDEANSLRENLWVKTDVGGMARYQHDYYHQIERENIEQVPGNPWAICTLWHGQWEIANASTMSELRRSLDVLEWAVKRAAPSGVMAEQFDPYTGDPISVSPLTWSHATYVITVLEYLEKHKELCSRTVATAR